MKTVSVKSSGESYDIEIGNPLSIAIPLNFGGIQPNAYDVEKAESSAFETGSLIGDTRRGGSCNFEKINFIPHCNGTHTECVGHITNERISVHDCLKDVFITARLISITPESANDTKESYVIALDNEDKLITRKSLQTAISEWQDEQFASGFFEGLIVRTLPNDKSKLTQTYIKDIPPFFSTEAIEFIRQLKIKHLLVDLPSIDRLFDEGKLSNHRVFWNVEPESFETNERSFIYNTITELIFVPDEIKDGAYLLNLQIAPFVADASPSRPVLFEIKR